MGKVAPRSFPVRNQWTSWVRRPLYLLLLLKSRSEAHHPCTGQLNATIVIPRRRLSGGRTTRGRRYVTRAYCSHVFFVAMYSDILFSCGLYYKLHGAARPISMKSDVIRKRSRHDARRASGMPDTPSASPDVSRRTSPAREASPTLAPDSTTQMSYDYHEDITFPTSQSELLGALGHDLSQFQGYLPQMYTISQNDPLPFAAEPDAAMSPRSNKRRRMSTDSASEPPSSASYSSYNDGYSSASSATSHSQRSSMEFPFSSYLGTNGSNGNCTVSSPFSSGPVLRGSGNTFWHPPMMPQGQGDMDASPNVFHPPMLPPTHEDSPMDYLHPPMLAQDEESLFSTFLHPPMVVPEEQSHPPIYPNEWSGHDSYDASMRAY